MSRFVRTTCALASMLTVFAGCRQATVVAYRIPKENDQPASHMPAADAMSSAGGVATAGADAGSLAWTAPAAWREKPPSAMRKGSYTVGAEGGATADLSITAFPGDVGGEAANVNRWRGQVGLPEIPDSDVPASVTRLTAGSLAIGYVDLVNGDKRMLAAFVPYQGATWFFKLSGPDAVVAAAKPAYVQFLQTLRPADASAAPTVAAHPPMSEAAPGNMSGPAVAAAAGPSLKWTAPARWTERPAGGVRKGSYTITGEGGADADLAITAFPGDVGGELANVNRWRSQLALPPIAAEQLEAAVTRRNVGGLAVTIVELSGGTPDQPARLVGAMVPFGGSTWFFKLVGPDAVVAREKPAFLDFVNTLRAP